MDLGLKGSKAILAGAARGIGLATAKTLAAEGVDVAICARTADQVDSAVTELSGMGIKAFGEVVDMADPEAYKAFIEKAAGDLGGCDIFVPFASAGGGNASEEGWKNGFEIDLMGTVRGVEAALPFLKESGKGSIIAVSTTAAIEDFMGVTAYNSVKAAVINYASNLSQAVAPDNIRVNTVSPGPIYIDGGAWNFIKDNMTHIYDSTVAGIAMGRMGTAAEVANTIAFLSSPAAGFTTGCNVVIDGGLTKRVQY